jgi:hypothetical protein
MTVKLDLPYLSSEPDRHGNQRLYVRRNGRRIRIKQKRGTAAFAKAYAAALEELETVTKEHSAPSAAPRGTFGWLAAKYFASDEFQGLDPESQLTRRRVIESCLSEAHTDDDPDPMRNCPLQFITSKKIKRLRDLKVGKPGAANNRRKYLSAMFGWAIEAELMKSNPAPRRAPQEIFHQRLLHLDILRSDRLRKSPSGWHEGAARAVSAAVSGRATWRPGAARSKECPSRPSGPRRQVHSE